MKLPIVLFRRHQHAWKDVERTYGTDWVGYFLPVQWILQWCEMCGDYRQKKLKGTSPSGSAPLRTPVPRVFREE